MIPALLRGIDTAAFVVALATRLRSRGAAVGLTSMEDAARVFDLSPPLSRSELYWKSRITLIRRFEDLAVFDQVFGAVFEDAVLPLDSHARAAAANASVNSDPSGTEHGSGLPWATLPPAVAEADEPDGTQLVPHRLPSVLAELADQPFEQLSESELRQLGVWLETALHHWPTRRSRRLETRRNGRRVMLRATLVRARRTGWEPVRLIRSGPRTKRRRVVMLCDVSRSMQAPSVAYLHLMRALVLSTDAEAFAFATSLTRLTKVLAHRSAEEAFERAADTVADRFGGTRIAASLQALMSSRHGGLLRGAIVVIASDGWDSEPPERMTSVMARLHRRAHRVIWVNPRAHAPGFEPRVSTMAAALPFCDRMLPAGSFSALAYVLKEISSTGSHGPRAGSARP